MPTLRPFRDYSEKDVINFYSFSGTIPTNKGTLVKIVGDGFRNDVDPVEMIGNYGGFSVSNFVAQRYGVVSKVAVANAADKPLGMLLFDVKEQDENGELLKYHPHKAAEIEACISGQAVPIVTRGIFLYSGVITGSGTPVSAGSAVYAAANGAVSTTGTNQVGVFLGITGALESKIDNTAIALIKFSF